MISGKIKIYHIEIYTFKRMQCIAFSLYDSQSQLAKLCKHLETENYIKIIDFVRTNFLM